MQDILFIILSILLLICLIIYKNDIISPSISFCSTFVICTLIALVNTNTWNLKLNSLALEIVFLGVFFFVLGTLTITGGSNLIRKNKHISSLNDNQYITLSKLRLIIFLLFQILIRVLQYYVIIKNVGGGSFNNVISTYHYMSEQDNLLYDPFLIRFGNIICNASGYLLGYILVNNYFKAKVSSKLLIINVIIVILGSMLSGQRTDAFAIIVSIIAYYFIFINRKKVWKLSFNIKRITIFGILLFIFIISFKNLGMILGRGSDINSSDYIFSYLGAQIKNLSIITENNIVHSNIFGEQTFHQLYEVIGKYMGIDVSILPKTNNFSYNFVNGHPLGNVYSTFVPFFLDFGLKGVVVISFLMGGFSQYIYNRVKYISNYKDRYIDYSSILYGYIYFPIIFSFFSNKFFEMVFSIRLIYYMIAIFLLHLFFIRQTK